MDQHSEILNKFNNHFTRINEELDRGLNSRVSLVEDIGSHTLLGEGKRLRPLLFVLACRLCNYQGSDVYRISTIFEYIHASSLLHDDVLDNAETRRKKPSANHLWGNHAAVLEGDFLYSKASTIAVETNSLPFLKKIADTTMQMTEGQILELTHTDDWNIGKKEYMEIITAKTAVLISAACACGAILSQAGEEVEKSLERFGRNVGVAFQLMDDLLDYTSSEEIFGKPVGKDLKEGKITLPLTYTLLKLEESKRKRFEDLFISHRATEQDYRNLTGLVRTNGALDQIRDEAQRLVNEAATSLKSFPDSPVKKNLLELSQYIVDREY
ncbi:MAG: polyprenyl synthetase family protein [Deltaproteobacteria bacterium]|nr:polyprenyl synthetase family protein [Deltaproteobacteria bacterium]MBW2117300.1 polyprenyl synthetase family protein [Deltaproteobacteria bacterium]MBW2342635.1 polyprenyl synthetase family protein [Deltaproteobacteria bacterium]